MYMGNRREDDLQVHDHLWDAVIPLRQALHRDVGAFILIFFFSFFTSEVLYIIDTFQIQKLSKGIRHFLKMVLSMFSDWYSGAHSTVCPDCASQQMLSSLTGDIGLPNTAAVPKQ